MNKELEIERILKDFYVSALQNQASNPDDFNLSKFVKLYSSTPIFKMRTKIALDNLNKLGTEK